MDYSDNLWLFDLYKLVIKHILLKRYAPVSRAFLCWEWNIKFPFYWGMLSFIHALGNYTCTDFQIYDNQRSILGINATGDSFEYIG